MSKTKYKEHSLIWVCENKKKKTSPGKNNNVCDVL